MCVLSTVSGLLYTKAYLVKSNKDIHCIASQVPFSWLAFTKPKCVIDSVSLQKRSWASSPWECKHATSALIDRHRATVVTFRKMSKQHPASSLPSFLPVCYFVVTPFLRPYQGFIPHIPPASTSVEAEVFVCVQSVASLF